MQDNSTDTMSRAPFIHLLSPQEDSPSLYRRAVDTVRRGWTLQDDSPAGVYFSESGELVYHPGHSEDPSGIDSGSEISGESRPETSFGEGDASENTTAITSLDNDAFTKDISDVFDREDSLDADVSDFGGSQEGLESDGLFLQTRKVDVRNLLDDALLHQTSAMPKEFYQLQLTTRQFNDNLKDGFKDTTFQLEIDTGSNTTWIRGEQVRKIVGFQDKPPLSMNSTNSPSSGLPVNSGRGAYQIMRFSSTELHNKSRLLNHHIFVPTVPEGEQTTFITTWQGQVSYGGGQTYKRTILLGRPKDPRLRKFKLQSCFKWNAQQSWLEPLGVDCEIPVAICGTERYILSHALDGILGLGTLRYQNAFRKNAGVTEDGDVPSFLQQISGHLERIPGEAGNILYFMLRPPPSKEGEMGQPSYLALQKWPTVNEPLWSPKIPVHGNRKWRIPLKGMAIWHGVDAASANVDTLSSRVPSVQISLDQPLNVILDTGSTLSYLPTDMIVGLLDDAYINRRPRSGEQNLSPYYVDPAFTQKALTVQLNFTAGNGQDASIFVPALSFLYNTRGEGLVWATVTEDPKKKPKNLKPWGLLGINFFQVVYAAFHLPELQGVNPYVRFACQSQIETTRGKYDVPPTRNAT
ncbi:hypothetical protein C8Q78DRAFT_1053464 [Trametes maxima]|nr:hypothetical protein C8Q78DRAFT_1053464 [Trametes maxima]